MVLHVIIEQGRIPLATINKSNKTFEALVQKLTDLQKHNLFVRKDRPRYAIRHIKETVARLFPSRKNKGEKQKHFLTFLIW
jgi:uncharacterized protein YjiK